MSFTPNSSGVANSLERIEQFIQEVSSWMSANRLKLNGDKTKMLVVGTPQQCLKVSMHRQFVINCANRLVALVCGFAGGWCIFPDSPTGSPGIIGKLKT